jgi:predicted phosphodiesterase
LMRMFIVLVVILFAAPNAAAVPAKEIVQVNPGPFTFAVISDSRAGDRVYSKIVDALVKRNPDFVVHVGDIMPTMGNLKQWENFQRLSAPIKVPFYLTPGNHDIEDRRSKELWRKQVDLPGLETYYKFTAGKNLFVVLNSNEPDELEMITGKQLEWLKNTLDPGKYTHQFVFVHHPVFMWKGAFHEGEALDRHPEARDKLHRLFVEKKVDIVFNGHEHTYKRMDVDGVRYIVMGGAGSRLYSGFNHFTLVTVDGAVIKVKVIDKNGMLRDEFMMGDL